MPVLRLIKKEKINPHNAQLERLLAGGDLRSIGKVNSIISKIRNQNDFDELFDYLFHQDRLLVMRTADAIEKITVDNPLYLQKHKKKIIEFYGTAHNKELKWHVALLIPRLHLDRKELMISWNALKSWATDKNESRIVRVNAIQALYQLSEKEPSFVKDLNPIFLDVEREGIPSIKARIKIIRKKLLFGIA